MVSEYLTHFPIKIMPSNLQSKLHSCKFQMMGKVISLMLIELTRNISNHSTVLHQNTTKTLSRSITENNIVSSNGRKSENWSKNETVLQFLKVMFTLIVPFKFYPFRVKRVKGATISKKCSTNCL